MDDLLETAVTAHGDLDRWSQITSITVDASIGGAFWSLKNQNDALKQIRFEVETTRQRLTMDFIGQDKRSVFDPFRVEMQRSGGDLVEARDDPETSFEGHEFETPWDDLLYFTGQALWTYLNIPFLYTTAGFSTEKIDPIDVDDETWRRLKVRFPGHIKTIPASRSPASAPMGCSDGTTLPSTSSVERPVCSTPPIIAKSTASSSRPHGAPGKATTMSPSS
jgi:hypothetical protein